MEEQLKYLLQLDDNRFERDPNFAFVYYNILQKKLVLDSVRFKVKAADQARVVRELLQVDRIELERLITKFKANSRYEATTPAQTQIISLVNKVGTMIHDLPGTAGYKLKMRNEIRAMVNMRGTPAFFITLNPSDINHPLVRVLAGDNICLEDLESGQELSEWDRKLLVADNPAACAKFFHEMISNFVTIILRYGRRDRGLLGKCTAYYGTVETQGRGTLHCHMLIWLEGHPSPQEMREKMRDSEQYQCDVFSWLESLIKCELLGSTSTVPEPNGPLRCADFSEHPGYVHPSTRLGPSVTDVPPANFDMRFASDVNDLVLHTNWHQHTQTCWKYLSPKDARTDENCRMRIDGVTRETTSVDEDTGGILLHRLHPRIANYNDVIVFLIRANMDIKHIGSGEGAKALIYYVTDYITKASLPVHVGLAALLYAINRTNDKYKDEPNWRETRHQGALTVMVNSLMARQEIPHQQVMSYLVGGGDNYKSEKFRVLYHGTFERLVQRYWPPDDAGNLSMGEGQTDRVNQPAVQQRTEETNDGDSNSIDITSDCLASLRRPDDNVTLVLGDGSISAVSQQQDYCFRPVDEPFDAMSLYEFTGLTEKVTKAAESCRTCRRKPGTENRRPRGRPEEARGEFCTDHPQARTHIVRRRTVWVVPVLLGG